MKRITRVLFLLLLMSLVFAFESFPQSGYWGRGFYGRGLGVGYNRMYISQNLDPTTPQRLYPPRFGRGFGRGGWGCRPGYGYGRMYYYQTLDSASTYAAYAPPAVQYGRGLRGGVPAGYGSIYDPATEETLQGKILSVEYVASVPRPYSGIHLQVKTDRETIPVHLGPEWYVREALAAQDISIEVDQNIEITGSRIVYAETPAVIAAKIKKGSKILTLRNEIGIPLWGGWGWRW